MRTQAPAAKSAPRPHALERGRESFNRQAWRAAFLELSSADCETPLDAEDLVLLAQSALLIGKEVEGRDILARAHQAFLTCGEKHPAARCAFWLGFTLMIAGEFAKAGGWLSRAGRLLDQHTDCVEKGYLLLPEGFRAFYSGDAGTAQKMFEQAVAAGERFGEKDLITLGLQGQGRALIRQGEISRGVTLLDEAMIAVTAGEVSPLSAGGVYCSVLDACGEIFDLRRAQEWTSALETWCASQPDLVPYRGHCLVRRAELLVLHGAWPDALQWAEQAGEWLSAHASKAAAGGAFYQVGEIQRLQGKLAESEAAYLRASGLSSGSGPGLARLRLAQGRVPAAMAAIRRVLEETREPGPRARALEACVEIALAAGDITAARAAADELAEVAARQDITFLRALSCGASGAVLLAEGKLQDALHNLRQSWNLWCELEVPHEASRVRFLIALACRKLGDEENALLELHAARETLHSLGAAVDLSRLNALFPQPPRKGALTARELQVLTLVASGKTNRQIAGKLKISEKTVARHMSNIFIKLGLSSRSGATAYAYDHGLVGDSH